MRFPPLRAALIFGAIGSAPLVALIALYWGPKLVPVILAAAVVWTLAFWLGARASARTYTLTRILLVVVIVWSFSYGTTRLVDDFLPSAMTAEIALRLVQLAFVFLAAWRLAPKVPKVAPG